MSTTLMSEAFLFICNAHQFNQHCISYSGQKYHYRGAAVLCVKLKLISNCVHLLDFFVKCETHVTSTENEEFIRSCNLDVSVQHTSAR